MRRVCETTPNEYMEVATVDTSKPDVASSEKLVPGGKLSQLLEADSQDSTSINEVSK